MNPVRGIFTFCRPISKRSPVSSKYSYATCLAKEKSSSKQINQLLIWSYDSGTFRIPCFVTVTTVTEWHPKTEGSIHTVKLKTNTKPTGFTWEQWGQKFILYLTPSKLAQAVTLPTCMSKVLGSSFGRDINYTDWSFRGISQANAGKEHQKLGHDRVLPHPFQFIIHFHIRTVIPRYIVWGPLK